MSLELRLKLCDLTCKEFNKNSFIELENNGDYGSALASINHEKVIGYLKNGIDRII